MDEDEAVSDELTVPVVEPRADGPGSELAPLEVMYPPRQFIVGVGDRYVSVLLVEHTDEERPGELFETRSQALDAAGMQVAQIALGEPGDARQVLLAPDLMVWVTVGRREEVLVAKPVLLVSDGGLSVLTLPATTGGESWLVGVMVEACARPSWVRARAGKSWSEALDLDHVVVLPPAPGYHPVAAITSEGKLLAFTVEIAEPLTASGDEPDFIPAGEMLFAVTGRSGVSARSVTVKRPAAAGIPVVPAAPPTSVANR